MQDFQHTAQQFLTGKAIEGTVAWKSPANIALVKYWGKKQGQIPCNASLSFALDKSYTETIIKYNTAKGKEPGVTFIFDGKKREDFNERIKKYFRNIYPSMPFLQQLDMRIESHNTFPHSGGIASSASAFSALSLCLCSIEKKLFNTLDKPGDLLRKASFLARMGSGSAARSIYEGMVAWGKHPEIKESSDEYAVSLGNKIHNNFNQLNDAILIVHSGSKKVSSSAGHHLMNEHPFANSRFQQANQNMTRILQALNKGDFDLFASVVEEEALSLHAMMMTSTPSYLLLKPESIAIIEKIRNFREQKGHQLCFTIDAGPNIHLIYTEKDAKPVREFIINELLVYCEAGNWLDDKMGNGPQELKKII